MLCYSCIRLFNMIVVHLLRPHLSYLCQTVHWKDFVAEVMKFYKSTNAFLVQVLLWCLFWHLYSCLLCMDPNGQLDNCIRAVLRLQTTYLDNGLCIKPTSIWVLIWLSDIIGANLPSGFFGKIKLSFIFQLPVVLNGLTTCEAPLSSIQYSHKNSVTFSHPMSRQK